jgi:hypoxanthine phosphoribosyltransferase
MVQPEREHVSWSDIDDLCERLARELEGSGTRFDVLLTIARGGLVPAGILAYRLGMRSILVACVAAYDDAGQMHEPVFLEVPDDALLRDRTVLVIDEVWDTGSTIAAVVERIRRSGGRPITAVLHYKPAHSRVAIVPNHYVVETDRWVVYPFKYGR